ncbi:acyltransferase domain-containing protein, partial [Streptomyces sp. FXJ1.4098]|nr:acyltransferase domain-containing protein [Streptomyces sp. FXJ1.4098]
LRVSHAFHSPLMEPMLDPFATVAGHLAYQEPRIPVVSTLTGRLATAEELCSPAYWVRQVRETVRFADGVRTLRDAGATAFVELGPDRVLAAMTRHTLADERPEPLVTPLLRADRDEETEITAALGALHVHGVPVDWSAYFGGTGAHLTTLPTYAFQRERFWPELEPGAAENAAADPVDAEFWSAVEREDLESLASTLEVDGDSLTAVVPALSSWRRSRHDESVVDGWRYEASWTPLTGPAFAGTPTGALEGTWLLIVPAPDEARVVDEEWLAAVAEALGQGESGTVRIEVADADRAALTARLGEVCVGDGPFAGVLSLLALGRTGPESTALTCALIQALGDADIEAPLWCATVGAVRVGRGDGPADPGQAAVWAWAGWPRWNTRSAGAASSTCPALSTSGPVPGSRPYWQAARATPRRTSSRYASAGCSADVWCGPRRPPPTGGGGHGAPSGSPVARAPRPDSSPGGWPRRGPSIWC